MSSMDAIDRAIALLNEALEADRHAMSEMMLGWDVLANEQLAALSAFRCKTVRYGAAEWTALTVLGLINGILGLQRDGWGKIAVGFEPGTRNITGFYRVKAGQEETTTEV